MTATCHRRAPSEYPRVLRSEAQRFTAALVRAGGGLDVPTCPGWDSRQLAEHVGGLYRWAEAHVRTRSQKRVSGKDLDLDIPEDFPALQRWVLDGVDAIGATLDAHDPDEPVWAWGSDRRARFWGRRMLFETVIHRADLELALGEEVDVDGATAVDGIDEFLDNLPHARYFAPDVENLRADDRTLSLLSSDVATTWTIRLLPDHFEWNHDAGGGDAEVMADASDLLLFVYGRVGIGGVKTSGDASLLERWVVNSRI